MAWTDYLKKGVSALPLLGNFVPDDKVADSSINTGTSYYDPAAQNSQQLYDQALARSQASYQAGNIGQVDMSQGNALQGRQVGNLNDLQGQINGPSVAQAQYNAMLGQQRNAALGAVAGSRGAGRGAARLNVAGQFGGNAGIYAQQGAAQALQERQGLQQQYAAALAQARGQDINFAGNQAQLRLSRDQAADDANRQAFNATHAAQLGYLGAANSAVGQQGNVAQGQAQTVQARYDLARAEEERRRRASAATRQAVTSTLGQVAGAMAGKPPTPGAA